jgi:thiol-disulfide isomerase/thioredoxin
MGELDRFLRRFFKRRPGRVSAQSLPVEGRAPEFKGLAGWLNGPALTMTGLAGKVVLVDFWTYSCVNCVRTLPYLNAWHRAYADKGLVIVGVHTPEFEFEKDADNVRDAVAKYGIGYPVAIDNDYVMWNAYRNHYWPAHYFIDARGRIRYHHFGEGGYGHSEAVLKALLEEAGAARAEGDASAAVAADVDFKKIGTPETYFGFARMEYLGSPESVRKDAPQRYSAVRDPAPNVFYLDGVWEIRDEYAANIDAGCRVVYKVTAAKVHMVMEGPGDGADVEVRLDGALVGPGRKGKDVGDDGVAVVRDGRLYDLVDLGGDYGTHLLELTFRSPGVKCYAFTFG